MSLAWTTRQVRQLIHVSSNTLYHLLEGILAGPPSHDTVGMGQVAPQMKEIDGACLEAVLIPVTEPMSLPEESDPAPVPVVAPA